MEDKSKIIIFERKELVLIFLFVLSVSLTTFTLGVKLGKSYSFKRDGISSEEQKVVQLKSVEEEAVEKMVREKEHLSSKSKELVKEKGKEKVEEVKEVGDEAGNRLRDEFQKLDFEKKLVDAHEVKEVVEEQAHRGEKKNASERHPSSSEEKKHEVQSTTSAYKGKYTIQLGSYHNQEDALKFADGFRIRGYNPIVNEVKIDGQGMWYRVGLGLFDKSEEAKSFIEQEESLFQGQDYVITPLE